MIIQHEISSREHFEIEKGTHRFDSLLIPLSGSFEYTYNGTTKNISAFMPLFFIKDFSFEKKVVHPIEYIIIRFSQLPEADSPWFEYKAEDQERLKSSILYLRNAILQNAPGNIIEHFVRDILLLANLNQALQEDEMTEIANYINEHYAKKLSLELLSEMAGYSKQTLIKKFYNQYQKTPAEYITMIRINKAKSLLANTSYSIGSIAEMCGYNNVYYFSNTFKKQTTLSPLSFRQRSKL